MALHVYNTNTQGGKQDCRKFKVSLNYTAAFRLNPLKRIFTNKFCLKYEFSLIKESGLQGKQGNMASEIETLNQPYNPLYAGKVWAQDKTITTNMLNLFS